MASENDIQKRQEHNQRKRNRSLLNQLKYNYIPPSVIFIRIFLIFRAIFQFSIYVTKTRAKKRKMTTFSIKCILDN